MAKKPPSVAAFEYGPSGLKFAEMQRDERRVLSAGVFPLEPGRWRDREHLAARVRAALDATARGKVERLIASVPLGHAYFRVLEVPADAADAREHLMWDMSRYLARPAEQYAFDFQPVPDPGTEDAGGRLFAAAAFRREEAAALRGVLESSSGLPLTALDVDAAAVVNAFTATHPEFTADHTLLIHANRHTVLLIRARHGACRGALAHRNADDAFRAPAEMQERAESLLRCAEDTAGRLQAAGDQWNRPDRVFLSGDLSASTDFRELLKSRLPAPVALLNPFRNVPGPDPAEHPSAYPGAVVAAAVGLALRLAEEP